MTLTKQEKYDSLKQEEDMVKFKDKTKNKWSHSKKREKLLRKMLMNQKDQVFEKNLTKLLIYENSSDDNIKTKLGRLKINKNVTNNISKEEINDALYPLKWKTRKYNDPEEEINIINELVKDIEKEENNLILMTNYNFSSK